MADQHIAIVILNWNGREDTLACLESLGRVTAPAFTTILVDNGSSDGSVAAVASAFPAVTILKSGRNLGFVGGNNLALAHPLVRAADYVLLLNNDTIVDADFLAPLLAAAADPAVGIVSPVIYRYGTPDTIWFAGAYFDRSARLALFAHRRMDEPDGRPDPARPAWDSPYVPGCALLIKRRVLERIGALDPAYYLIFEDVDWCLKARRLGYRCRVVAQSRIWHKVGASFGGPEAPRYLYYYVRNQFLVMRRYFPLTQRLPWYYRRLRIYEWYWRHYRNRREAGDALRARAIVAGLADFVCGRLGQRDYAWLRDAGLPTRQAK